VNERIAVVYATGYITAWLNEFARTKGIPSSILIEQVGILLQPEGPGIVNHVPALPRSTATEMDQALGTMALDVRPHRHTRGLSAESRRKISDAQKARWAKRNGHEEVQKKPPGKQMKPVADPEVSNSQSDWWTKNFPTPELRAKEVRRRMKKGAKSKKIAAMRKAV
jgi:hypothetical protein